MTRTRLSLAVVLLALWGIGSADAATVLRLELPEVTARADHIVHGDVVELRAVWSDDHRRIYTDAEVRVRDTLKGEPNARIMVRLLGGEIDGVGQIIPGAPRLRVGEEVVLLLVDRPDGGRIIGLAQGHFRIARPSGGAAVARRDLRFVERVAPDAAPGSSGVKAHTNERAHEDADELPLEEVLSRLRNLVDVSVQEGNDR